MCPGYRNVFDLILRDETESVKMRELRKHCRRSTGSDSRPRSDDRPTVIAITNMTRCNTLGAIPNALKINPEEAALSSWFNSLVMLHRVTDTQRGYLGSLMPLYISARHESPVSLATSAVALVIFARRPTYRPLLVVGRKTFGDALALTREALQDPIQSKEDETLMAVLLLGMVEGLLAGIDGKLPSNAHLKGALALVKYRGKHGFKTDISRRLFASVQTQTISHAVKECVPPDKLWDNWMEIMPCSAPNRLTLVKSEVANLLSSAGCIFSNSHAVVDSQLLSLACSARDVQKQLMIWACTVPVEWTPKPAQNTSPATLSKFQAYGTRMDMYPDIWVVSFWNTYRVLHITVQIVIATCWAMMKVTHGVPSDSDISPETTPNTIQELVDDVCASVPFCLGDRTEGEPDAVEYPCAEGLKVPIDRQRVAVSVSGWFLIGPITGCLMVGGLREAQVQWLKSQLSRITKLYGDISLGEVDTFFSQMLPCAQKFSQQALRGSVHGGWMF